MKENRRSSDLVRMLRFDKDIGFPGPGEKPSMKEMAIYAVRRLNNLERESLANGYFDNRVRGLSDVDADRAVLSGITSTHNGMMCDILSIYKGVVLHVRDRGLVEALLRTDIDAMVADIRMPFPIVEIVYPSGIMLGDRYQISGTLMVDTSTVNFQKEFPWVKVEQINRSGTRAGFTMVVNLLSRDGHPDIGQNVMMFGPPLAISEIPCSPDLDAVERKAVETHARLACALFLYLQGVERSRALRRIEHNKEMSRGMVAMAARLDRNLPRYELLDVVSKSQSDGISHGGHHASPDGHWRRGHMRVLRDNRFLRNEDGSMKSIWVRPCLVNSDIGEAVSGSERYVEAS